MTNKSPNGEGGTSFHTSFNPDIPEEKRALKIARDKAIPHGQRKRLIVAFFNAIADYEESTGRDFTTATISSMFMTMGMIGNRPASNGQPLPDLKEIDIKVGGGAKVDKQKSGDTFAKSRGSLFG